MACSAILPPRAALLPGVACDALRQSDAVAFGGLLEGLTAVTLLCALAAFVFLSRGRVHDEPAAEPARSRERRALALDRECG
ncbi:EmrB/QacA family drug resistance transporter [Burkholderia pseudomallei]|uniref:hypothetical protein n=1 Tax=Burkholderia pseudomallei TaxID=28450 RepID=UPI000F11A12F|nr:hypothetical protein [Burkholderia pseudomallei]VBI25951.1 EmrB/QacA family drug resistance transporter [Burkholderia pseudomallei]